MATQLIRLTLHDGDPEGLRSAAIAGRTSILIGCPWTQFDALKQREEAKRPAVYFLVGAKNDSSEALYEQCIYIGECDSLVERFAGKHHKADSAEWSQVFLATTLEDTFNKAHARLAEHLLVDVARKAKRSDVQNGGTAAGKLSDGDAAFAREFVANTVILAQTLGLSLFRPSVSAQGATVMAENDGGTLPVFEFAYTKQSIPAQMILDGPEFVIKAGSKARATDGALSPSMLARREAARKSGVLKPSEVSGLDVFTADYPTKSTSTAGEMVYGSACTGPDAWRHTGTAQTYRAWLAAKTGTSNA